MKHYEGSNLTITDDHLALLRRTYVSWVDDEYGAPEINPKRPSGNSAVPPATYEILGWPFDEENPPEYDDERARAIHDEMEVVVELALHHPGEDVRGPWVETSGYGMKWVRD